MSFSCESCNVSFRRKAHLAKHTKSKKHKLNISNESSSSVLADVFDERIIKTDSRMILQLMEEIHDLRNQVKTQNSQIQKQNEQILKSCSRFTYNENCIVDNSTTIHINLRAYGKENWDGLSETKILDMMKKVNSSVPEIIRSLHFDSLTPENHNIKIPNKKIARVKVFDGTKWITQIKSVLIEDLIEKILDKCDDVEDKFKENASCFISNLWDEYSSTLRGEKLDKESQKHKKQIIERIECCILDNQHMMAIQ
jgi:hypothetical protein